MERKIWTTAAALTVVLAVTGVAWAGLPRAAETSTTVTVENELVAPAADAGTVTLRKVAAGLEVVSVSPADGWEYTVKRAAGREVEVDFRAMDGTVEFEAEIDNGQVRIKVKVRVDAGASSTTTVDSTSSTVDSTSTSVAAGPSTTEAVTSTTIDDSPSTTVDDTSPTTIDDDRTTSTTVYDDDDDDDHTTSTTVYDDDDDDRTTSTTVAQGDPADFGTKVYDVDGIGTVTVERDADGLTLIAVVSNPDWTINVEKAGPKEIEIEFRNGELEVKFEAELEYGELRIKIERGS